MRLDLHREHDNQCVLINYQKDGLISLQKGNMQIIGCTKYRKYTVCHILQI